MGCWESILIFLPLHYLFNLFQLFLTFRRDACWATTFDLKEEVPTIVVRLLKGVCKGVGLLVWEISFDELDLAPSMFLWKVYCACLLFGYEGVWILVAMLRAKFL